MTEYCYTVVNELGMHARPAGMFVKLAKDHKSKISIWKGDQSSDAVRIMNVMRMGIHQGDQVRITAEGEDEEETIAEVEKICRECL